MRAVYGEILSRIEARGFEVLGPRVVVPTGRKLTLLARVLLGADPFAARTTNPSLGQGILEPAPRSTRAP
jgi:hypothetical protein